MYNLLVTRDITWEDNSSGAYLEEHFLEYTDDRLKERLKRFDAAALAALHSLPALLVYEIDIKRPARVVVLTNVSKSESHVLFTFLLDLELPPIEWSALQRMQSALGVTDSFELRRTHWAIKDVDLPVVIRSTAAPHRAARGGETAPLLLHDVILDLHAAALRANLGGSRSELLAGLDPGLVQSLVTASTPGGQLLLDLEQLNRIKQAPPEAGPPLTIWLKNALALRSHFAERDIFVAALAKMSRAPGAAASPVARTPHRLRDVLRELRATLAALYPTRGHAVRLAEDAGIQPSRIDLDGSAEAIWHSVLDEAKKQELLSSLVAIARVDYPRNAELARLAESLQRSF
jgi:Effector-associated domain 1/Effector-associated domain 5